MRLFELPGRYCSNHGLTGEVALMTPFACRPLRMCIPAARACCISPPGRRSRRRYKQSMSSKHSGSIRPTQRRMTGVMSTTAYWPAPPCSRGRHQAWLDQPRLRIVNVCCTQALTAAATAFIGATIGAKPVPPLGLERLRERADWTLRVPAPCQLIVTDLVVANPTEDLACRLVGGVTCRAEYLTSSGIWRRRGRSSAEKKPRSPLTASRLTRRANVTAAPAHFLLGKVVARSTNAKSSYELGRARVP